MFSPTSSAMITLHVLLLFISTTALKLTITPPRAHIQAGTRLKVMCQADAPLAGCQFKRTFVTPIYDLTRGPLTPSNTQYSYYGTGLDAGECGITLSEYVKDHTYDLIGCRVREDKGPWTYASLIVVINANDTYTFTVQSKELVVQRGSSVSILCQADQPLSSCFFKWQGQSAAVMVNESVVAGKYRYHGLGLDKGQCGVTLVGVAHANSGDVFCSAWTKMKPKGYESDTTTLIVATAPTRPVMTLSRLNYSDGDSMTATCVVRNGRPIANITWYVGNSVARSDSLNEAPPEAAWQWSYSPKTMAQVLKRNVSWEDDGKELRCLAEHVSLPRGHSETKLVLNVKHSPRDLDQPIILRGFDIGDSAEILLQVSANPQPVFSWQIANQTIGELDVSADGRMQAPRGTKSGKLWEARLIISRLKLTDFQSDIFLTAKNEIGKSTYRVVIIGPKTPPTTTVAEPTPEEEDEEETVNTDATATETSSLPSTEKPSPSSTEKPSPSSTESPPVVVTKSATRPSTLEPEGTTRQRMATAPTVIPGNAVTKRSRTSKSAQKQSQYVRQASSHTGLILGLLAGVAVIGAAILAMYARATSRWCFRRRQFASTQIQEPFVDPGNDSDPENFQLSS